MAAKKWKPNPATPRIIVRGIHLGLREALKSSAVEKASRLFRHQERIVRLRFDLEHDQTSDPAQAFIAKGHIEIHGPNLVASVSSDDLQKSLDGVIDKLDGMLRRRASAAKTSRRRTDPSGRPPGGARPRRHPPAHARPRRSQSGMTSTPSTVVPMMICAAMTGWPP